MTEKQSTGRRRTGQSYNDLINHSTTVVRSIVRTRRHVDDYDDPYIQDESLQDNSVCMRCGSVYVSGRWYLKDGVPQDKIEGNEPVATICPGCQKMRDKVPGGVLRIMGSFPENHRREVMNLIHNETSKAQAANPLEKVMSMEEVDGGIELTTTNEKLAQRIGRALHKAYDGDIEYKWSEDNKLARVNWRRDQ